MSNWMVFQNQVSNGIMCFHEIWLYDCFFHPNNKTKYIVRNKCHINNLCTGSDSQNKISELFNIAMSVWVCLCVSTNVCFRHSVWLSNHLLLGCCAHNNVSSYASHPLFYSSEPLISQAELRTKHQHCWLALLKRLSHTDRHTNTHMHTIHLQCRMPSWFDHAYSPPGLLCGVLPNPSSRPHASGNLS